MTQEKKFRDLGLEGTGVLQALDKLGFTKPTEIQEKSIPLILEGKDIIGGSATGSGKTIAFLAGIIPRLHKGAGIQLLVLTPTRELAEQILQVMKDLSHFDKLVSTAIYGGVSINPQFKQLQRADLVVGTPGRILDHLERGTIDLTTIKHLVLDEADRMLDMGFLDDVRKIMSRCPAEKQTLLYSATIQREIEHLAKDFMRSPVKISVKKYVDPKKLHQEYYDVPSNLKFSLLAHLIKQERNDSGLIMVFTNSRTYADTIAKNLNAVNIDAFAIHGGLTQQRRNAVNIDAFAIHGGLTQQRRNKVLEKFNKKDKFVLTCTDVAARGLDIPGVTHVYNYDIPNDTKQYVHRIGRTARAGKDGKVVNLISNRDYDSFGRIFQENDFEIKKMDRPRIERIQIKQERSNNGYSRSSNFYRGGDGRGSSRGEGRSRSSNGSGRGRQNVGSEGKSSYGSRINSGRGSSRGSSYGSDRNRGSDRGSGNRSRSGDGRGSGRGDGRSRSSNGSGRNSRGGRDKSSRGSSTSNSFRR